MPTRRAIAVAIIAVGCLIVAYLAGVYSYAKNLGPVEWLRTIKRELTFKPEVRPGLPTFDAFNRLTGFPGKQEVRCPLQTGRTMVLLLIGQSNAANNAGQRYASAHGDGVVNYYGGKCFVAASPLLGATGHAGESWTLLGNKLVASGRADRVVLVSAAIGGSWIRRWKEGSDLNGMLQSVLDDLRPRYRISHVLWQQGEADSEGGMGRDDYAEAFNSLVGSMRRKGVDAPVFPSVSTKCGMNPDWRADNPVALAQKSLPDKARGIFPGVDTDAILGPVDRYDDCHFSATGQEKFADAWAGVLAKTR